MPQYRARMHVNDVYVGAQFRVVSEPLDYRPDVEVQEGESFLADLYWNDFETRVVRYANTGERALFYPPIDAPVERGIPYRIVAIHSTEELANSVVTVGVNSVETTMATERLETP